MAAVSPSDMVMRWPKPRLGMRVSTRQVGIRWSSMWSLTAFIKLAVIDALRLLPYSSLKEGMNQRVACWPSVMADEPLKSPSRHRSLSAKEKFIRLPASSALFMISAHQLRPFSVRFTPADWPTVSTIPFQMSYRLVVLPALAYMLTSLSTSALARNGEA